MERKKPKLRGRDDPAPSSLSPTVFTRGCCLNDPTSNFPPLLVALDAAFVVVGRGGERRLDAGDFFTGTLCTALAPGELLAAVEIPAPAADSRVGHCHLQVAADSWAEDPMTGEMHAVTIVVDGRTQQGIVSSRAFARALAARRSRRARAHDRVRHR
jgi:CO/xanthine dehydrogenase FAD-binding subunit